MKEPLMVFARVRRVKVGRRSESGGRGDEFVDQMRKWIGHIIVLQTTESPDWYWHKKFWYHKSWLKIYGVEAGA